MNRIQKIAISRLFTDLIKADSIICEEEMKFWKRMKTKYSISSEELKSAVNVTFAKALSDLMSLSETDKISLNEDVEQVTISDGFCAREEALLVLAFRFVVMSEFNESDVFSVKANGLSLSNKQVIYVESKINEHVNNEIKENYRRISNELKINGFEFVYIPSVIEHYKNTNEELFLQIISFIAPCHCNNKVIGDAILDLTTPKYCIEQLGYKLDMKLVESTSPALLIKVGDSLVNDETHANFLLLDLKDNVVQTIENFTNEFSSLQSSEYRFISQREDKDGDFLYYGFYKHLFDLFLYQHNIKCSMLIDLRKNSIVFPEIEMKLDLHRKEKALYILFLTEEEGLNFRQPINKNEMVKYKKRIESYREKYSKIYCSLGGDHEKIPDIISPEIRNPMLSSIKKAIKNIGEKLYMYDNYYIKRDLHDLYSLNVNLNTVFVRNLKNQSWNSIKDVNYLEWLQPCK